MLELSDQAEELVKTVGPLKCAVELPAEWQDYFERTGQVPGRYQERRRHPRYYYRVCAALQHRQTFPALNRPTEWYQVYANDVSRGGLSFMHGEQLFPRERMPIVLPRLGMSTIEIVWCLRVKRHCFHVGARFLEQFREFVP